MSAHAGHGVPTMPGMTSAPQRAHGNGCASTPAARATATPTAPASYGSTLVAGFKVIHRTV